VERSLLIPVPCVVGDRVGWPATTRVDALVEQAGKELMARDRRPERLCPWPHVLCRRKPTGRRADLRGPGEHDGAARVGLWKRAGAARQAGVHLQPKTTCLRPVGTAQRGAGQLSARPSAQTFGRPRDRRCLNEASPGSPARGALRTRDGVDSLRPCALQRSSNALSSCASAMGPGASHSPRAGIWPAWLAAAKKLKSRNIGSLCDDWHDTGGWSSSKRTIYLSIYLR